MIERLIESSIRNRGLVLLVTAALAAWGIYAVLDTPMDAIPDLSENQVIVFADWMGRSPKEIEDQVTYPLSLKLQGLAGVRVVRLVVRVQLLDDHDHLRGSRRLLLRSAARVGEADAGGDIPAGGRDAVPGAGRYGGWARSSGTRSNLGPRQSIRAGCGPSTALSSHRNSTRSPASPKSRPWAGRPWNTRSM